MPSGEAESQESEAESGVTGEPWLYLVAIGFLLLLGVGAFGVDYTLKLSSPNWKWKLAAFLRSLALVGSSIGIFLSLLILLYQRRLENQSRRQQRETVEQIAERQTSAITEATRNAAYEASAALKSINIPDGLNLIENRIDDNHLKELIFVSRFSVVPLFWYDRSESKRSIHLWEEADSIDSLLFLGPELEKVKEYSVNIARRIVNEEKVYDGVSYWHNLAKKEMGISSIESISNNGQKVDMYIEEFRAQLIDDYKLFVERMEDDPDPISLSRVSVEDLPEVNTVVMELTDDAPEEYSHEMIIFADSEYVDLKMRHSGNKEDVELILEEPDLYKCNNNHVIMPYYNMITRIA